MRIARRIRHEWGQEDTSMEVDLDALGVAAPERVEYVASPWVVGRRLIPQGAVRPEDVFVDFGAGKGRMVVLMARSHPFARVIGVEVAEPLAQVARRNVERVGDRLAARSVEIVTADAAQYEVPDDITHAYLYNPFLGETFRTVMARLAASVERRPRALTVFYVNPVMHDAVLATGRFALRRCVVWRRRHEFTLNVYQAVPPRARASGGLAPPSSLPQ